MDRLPVFRLARPQVDAAGLIDVAGRVFDITDGFAVSDAERRLSLRRGDHLVEMETASGGVWAADHARWFDPSTRPSLISGEDATALAEKLGRGRGLLPDLERDFSFGVPHVAGTHLAVLEDGERREHQLDVQVVYAAQVGSFPVVGGGGDVTFAFGDGGELVGYTGVWRDPRASFDAAVVPQERADEEFRALFEGAKGLELQTVTSSLAYYAAPSFVAQEFLYPVYVYTATAQIGDATVSLRSALLPATDFGPKLEIPPPAPPRPRGARPPSKPGPESRKRRTYASTRDAAAAPTKPWEAGASWIGVSGGLTGSKDNAQGFIDEWAADGWIIDFNWGDGAAWESDWRRNDDQWVDNADFVFYTGHANGDGWVLSKPDDGFLSFTEVGNAPGTPGDLWGSSDLEWVVVAACGPLQDDVISAGGGDVLARWDGAFDGMHQLLGYGAVTNDNKLEGRRLASLCRSGMTVKDAWFRAAKEIQPSTNSFQAPNGPTVWVGTMWVSKPGADPIGDHAWSHGSVSADPTSPTQLSCMWTVC